jgi:hypothetical protein
MFFRILSLLFLVASTGFYFGCFRQESIRQEVIIVKIPPFYDPNLTAGQNHWLWSEFLFPHPSAETREKDGTIPDFGVPNDDSVITVRLSDDGRLFINSENYGDLANTELVEAKLREIFNVRNENGVVEPGSGKVVKAVGLRLPLGAKYADLIALARAVKRSGADPIVLLINDHLPEMRIFRPGR